MPPDHEYFMRAALDLSRQAIAQGNRPVGSIIVDATGTPLAQGGRHAGIGRTDIGGYSIESMFRLTGRSFELVTGVPDSN